MSQASATSLPGPKMKSTGYRRLKMMLRFSRSRILCSQICSTLRNFLIVFALIGWRTARGQLRPAEDPGDGSHPADGKARFADLRLASPIYSPRDDGGAIFSPIRATGPLNCAGKTLPPRWPRSGPGLRPSTASSSCVSAGTSVLDDNIGGTAELKHNLARRRARLVQRRHPGRTGRHASYGGAAIAGTHLADPPRMAVQTQSPERDRCPLWSTTSSPKAWRRWWQQRESVERNRPRVPQPDRPDRLDRGPKVLSDQLRRLAPALRSHEVYVSHEPRTADGRGRNNRIAIHVRSWSRHIAPPRDLGLTG